MYYYKFHIGDYRGATTYLSNEEDLAYRRLLDMYYDTEKPIPLETQTVSKRLRVGIESVVFVLEEFFKKTDDGWVSKRCEDEISEYTQKCARNKEAGKLGGRPRKTQTVSKRFPDETQMKPRRNPDVTLSINHKPLTIKENSGNKVPPTLEDVKEYCLERQNGVDPERWFNFYQAKNWMIGKNKMKDWRAAVRTWEEKKPSKKEQTFGGYTFDA